MRTFRDMKGREWLIQINVAAVKRVRTLVDVDLLGLVDQGFGNLGKLLSDPVRLVDVLYALCKAEADAKGVTDEQFGEAMAGDAIEHAADAFLQELTDFFPNPRIRAGLKRVVAAAETLSDRMMDQMEARIDAIDLDAESERLTASAGSSPESSASTPAPSLSANST